MSRHWRSVLFVVLICCVMISSAFAETAKVVGTIRNTDYDPLAGYSVSLRDVSTRAVVSTLTTSADGKYQFGFVQPGTYVLVISKDGKEVKTSDNFEVEVGAVVQQSLEVELVAAAPPTPPVDPCVANPNAPGCAKPTPAIAGTTTPVPAAEDCAKTPDTAHCKQLAHDRCLNNATDPACRTIYCSIHREASACVQRAQTVVAKGPSLDTNTSISSAVTRDQLQSLPLYNRNFLVLGALTPNTHDLEASSTLRGGSFSISGVRGASNSFLLDGIDNNAGSTGQAIPFQVNDSIREFRVTSAGAGAEYGRNAGGTVDIVTQRAGGKWHGGAYGFFGSDSMNALSAVSPYSNSGYDKAATYAGAANLSTLAPTTNVLGGLAYVPQTYNQYAATAQSLGYCTNPVAGTCNPLFDPSRNDTNDFKAPWSSQQFGTSIGGPVYKDKLFLFGSYEGTRIDNPNMVFERVPSMFDRGLQSGLVPQAQIFVPQLAGLNIDSAQDYSMAQNLMNLYPKPNVIGAPGALEFYQGTAPNYTNVDNLLLRGDWNFGGGGRTSGFSKRHTLTARYAVQRLNQLHDDSLPSSSKYAGNGALRDAVNQSGSLAVTSFLSPRVSNDFRIGTNRFQVLELPQDRGFDPSTVGLLSGSMPTIFLSGLDTQYAGLNCDSVTLICTAGAVMGWQDLLVAQHAGTPNRMLPTLDGLFPMARLGAPLTAPSRHRDTGGFISNQMGVQWGKNALKFGGEFRVYQNQYTSGGQTRGYINSQNIGQFAADSEACFFFCGALNSAFAFPSFDYRIQQPSDYRGLLKSYAAAGFMQDTLAATEHLTLNFGLRYEYFSVPDELHNQIWNYDPGANGLVRVGSKTTVNPYGSPCSVTGTVPNFLVPGQWTGQNLGWRCGDSQHSNLYPDDKVDLAPRVGFAYSPGKKNDWVIRGSFGLYYDQQPAANLEQMLLNRPNPLNLDNPQALYGNYFSPGNCNLTGFCGGIGNNTLSMTPMPAGLSAFNAASVPGTIYAKDYDHSKTSYVEQISGSVQHRMSNNITAELGYVGTYGYRLPVVVNTNFQNEWFCNNPVGTGTPNPCDPFSFAPIFTQMNEGKSEYHSMMARFHGNWSHLSVNATYTYSHAMDNVASSMYPTIPVGAMSNLFGFQLYGTGQQNALTGLGFRQGMASPFIGNTVSTPTQSPDFSSSALTTNGQGQIFTTPYAISQNPMNWAHDDWGNSDFDARQRFVMDYTYKFGKRDNWFLSDWQASSIVILQGGQPYTVFSSMFGELTQRVNTKDFTEMRTRENWLQPNGSLQQYLPSLTSACSSAMIGGVSTPTGGYVDGAPFQGQAGNACTGTTPRNAFFGPEYFNVDFAIQKQVRFKNAESRVLTFRSEFFNLLNRNNFYNPDSILSFDGQTMNPDFGKIKSAHTPFQMQLAIRFAF